MAFTDKSEFNVPRHIVQKGSVNVETITGNKTLTYASSTYQLLRNNTGTLDCILPDFKDGARFWVKNRSASTSNVVVKDGDTNTIATLAAGEAVHVVSTATAWWDVIKA